LRKVRSLVIGLLGIGVSSSLSSLRNKFFISEAICFNSQYAPRVFIQEKVANPSIRLLLKILHFIQNDNSGKRRE